jgi:hypothetical protein
MSIPTVQDTIATQKPISYEPISEKKLAQASQFFETFNAYVKAHPQLGIDPIQQVSKDQFIEEYLAAKYPIASKVNEMYQKAITGATAATGSALVGQTYMPVDMQLVALEVGNVFVESGARTAISGGQVVFPAFQNFGDFVDVTPANDLITQTVNDVAVNVGVNRPVTPTLQRAEIPLFQSPSLAAYLGNRGALFALFEQILEIKKGVRADQKLIADVITNPTGITALAAQTGSFPITKGILTLITQLARYDQAGNMRIYLSHFGLTKLMTEQSTTGDLRNAGMGEGTFVRATGEGIPNKGRVGWIAGREVHLTPAIRSNYAVDGSNAITTGTGTNTFALVGVAPSAGIVKGQPEDDFVTVFEPNNSLVNFRTGTTTIGAMTMIGGGLLNPYMWGYYAFAA